ncbi:hypothetical protein K8R42_00345, partial [bacterium]|nr:hypothetical protein [bacterium]
MTKNKIFNGVLKQKLLTLILILPLFLAGCINVQQKETAGVYGGVFRTGDLGETWQHTTEVYTVGGQAMNFTPSNIITMEFDPMYDPAIYVGTQHDGMFYSYNYANGWFQTLTGVGTINDLFIDPKRNCTIYAAVHNNIYKTVDCSRTWEIIYFETRPNQFITQIAVSQEDNRIVYAGTSGGSFLRSQDYGASWDVLKRFNNSIKNIIIQNGHDSNRIYVVTQTTGIFRTSDGGFNWDDLMKLPVDESELDEDTLKPFNRISNAYHPLSVGRDKSVDDGIVYATKT